MQGSGLSMLCGFLHLLPRATQWAADYYYAHFTDEETNV